MISKSLSEESLLISLPQSKNDVFFDTSFHKDHSTFHIMTHEEPHTIRRKNILEKYPEIKSLFGKDSLSIYLLILVNFLQIISAYFVSQKSWFAYLFTLYCFGAVLSHTLQVLVHDLTHFTCFESIFMNKIFAICCNISTGLPTAISFGRYHYDHHIYLNKPGYDPDLPSQLEIKYINNSLKKSLFLLFLPIFYAIRPYFVRPKKPNKYEIGNIVFILFIDYLFIKYMGFSFFFYLVFSSLIGMGFHPVGMHVIAEHYEFYKNQETYSYYGILNIPNLNLGYHVEHHDFPMIPWRKLPLLRKIAPEFYENLPEHKSYVFVAFKYIFDCNIGPWSRVGRVDNNEERKSK